MSHTKGFHTQIQKLELSLLLYMPSLLNLVEIWENLSLNLILNTCTILNVKENSLL